jgi:steroid delta-isomerase-like uncharacterized protein
MPAQEETKAKISAAFLDAFNHGNLAALDEICAPDMVDHSTAAAPGQPAGLPGFKLRIAGHRTGMPDLQFTIANMIIEGNLVAFQWTMSGTNTGPYLGRPASGNAVMITGMNMERLADGKITEHWSYPDKLELMQQLGAIPMPAKA